MKSNTKPHSENHFVKEWNETGFYLSIPAKITHSNKPFVYFYWPNPERNATNRKRVDTDSWHEPLFVAQINTILKRNYKILKLLVTNHQGPTTVGRFYLVEKNFSFRFYTSVLTTTAGTYYFIYNHGWRELPDEKIMVVMDLKQVYLLCGKINTLKSKTSSNLVYRTN